MKLNIIKCELKGYNYIFTDYIELASYNCSKVTKSLFALRAPPLLFEFINFSAYFQVIDRKIKTLQKR